MTTTMCVLAMLRDTRNKCMSDALLSKAETARGRGLVDDSEGMYTLRRRGEEELNLKLWSVGVEHEFGRDPRWCRCRCRCDPPLTCHLDSSKV
jgi:hypothetical protein